MADTPGQIGAGQTGFGSQNLTGVVAQLQYLAQGQQQILTAIGDLSTDLQALDTDLQAINTTLATFFPNPLNASKTYDPVSLLTLTSTSTTVTVTGAVLGNYALASFSLDLQGMTMTAYVSAADTVTAVIFNGTAGTLNIASGTLRVKVFQ